MAPITARLMRLSENRYVKVLCKDGEVIEGFVSKYTRAEDNYPQKVAQIEIERANCYIVLKHYEMKDLQIIDTRTGLEVSTKPTKGERFIAFLLGKNLNK